MTFVPVAHRMRELVSSPSSSNNDIDALHSLLDTIDDNLLALMRRFFIIEVSRTAGRRAVTCPHLTSIPCTVATPVLRARQQLKAGKSGPAFYLRGVITARAVVDDVDVVIDYG